MQHSLLAWKTFWICTSSRFVNRIPSSAWMKNRISFWMKPESLSRWSLENQNVGMENMSATEPAAFLFSQSRWLVGDT